MILGIEWWQAAIAIVIVFIGAVVQGSIGTGLGLLAAPVLAAIDIDFVPGALLLAVLPLTVGMAVRERGSIDRPGALRAIAGRLPGTLVGAWVVARADHAVIAGIIGVCVLVAIIASVTGLHFRPTPRNVLLAGVASGFTGTATGVGGPPMAITYQHSDPEMLRSTLAVFFFVGGLLSILALVVTGAIGERQLQLSALLLPGVLAGLVVSRTTARRLPAATIRPIVLVTCAVSAMLLIGEQLG